MATWTDEKGGKSENNLNNNIYTSGGSTAGHYDWQGRWVSGTKGGFYTSRNGEWCEGTVYGGYRNSQGQWISGSEGGYFNAQN